MVLFMIKLDIKNDFVGEIPFYLPLRPPWFSRTLILLGLYFFTAGVGLFSSQFFHVLLQCFVFRGDKFYFIKLFLQRRQVFLQCNILHFKLFRRQFQIAYFFAISNLFMDSLSVRSSSIWPSTASNSFNRSVVFKSLDLFLRCSSLEVSRWSFKLLLMSYKAWKENFLILFLVRSSILDSLR